MTIKQAAKELGAAGRKGPFLAGIATEILIITLIVYTPWGHALFGTASIALAVWLFIIPLRVWHARARRVAQVVRAHPP